MTPIRPCTERARALRDVPTAPDALVAWMEETGTRLGLTTLLAFADDGVVWGRIDGGGLTTAHDATGIGARLRAVTLHEARLFGEGGEILVWRTGQGATPTFRARVIGASEALADETARGGAADDDPAYACCYDEDVLLWGDAVVRSSHGFTLLQQGAEGLRHAVPVPVAPGASDTSPATPPRLRVRHLVGHDPETGLARVAASRLVRLVAASA